jgi:glycosyltransferase involved in cell wall biosynthesis
VTDLVVVSLEAWDGVWRRNQHLVSRLLASDPDLRVLFVEPPADPLHDARRRAGVRRGLGLRRAADRLWLFQPTKWLPRRLDPAADGRLASAVLRAASEVGMTRPTLWLNDPLAADLLRRTGWPALYDITDDWLLADRSPREHDRLVESERYLLDHCRHVVVCSPRLLETKSPGRAERVTLVPNAVDVDAYRASAPRPDDLPSGPVVLYVGTLHRDRLDVDLCAELARGLRGEATFVLAGPVALDTVDQTLLTDAGALLLGPREHATIPAYLKNADVLVVPHVVTDFTDSLDPIKVYEYLAAGRPVVSTPVAGFRELDLDHVSVVPGSGLLPAVSRALADGPVPAEQTHVPSWDERAGVMRRIIDETRGS